MTIRSQRDFLAGLFLVIVGGAFAIGATQYNFGIASRPGPGYFPLGLGLILAVLGLIVLATSLVREIEGGDPVGSIPWRPLICIAGALVFFGFALPRVGFVISFPLMIVFTAMAGDEFRWKEAIFNAVLLTAFSYGVFVAGLKLTIPLWPA
ncbi:MAG: tripartite tricarboxylate transporter TctB family protein [Betaproteobacteria bacterium]|nr:tripartite tricarboxylate transporter TctB family protein [Betaproteobacteria bacterium]